MVIVYVLRWQQKHAGYVLGTVLNTHWMIYSRVALVGGDYHNSGLGRDHDTLVRATFRQLHVSVTA